LFEDLRQPLQTTRLSNTCLDRTSVNAGHHAENARQGRFALKDLCCVQPAVHVAEKMGERLGAGQNLFGSLQGEFTPSA
jgi:hypothetical protein